MSVAEAPAQAWEPGHLGPQGQGLGGGLTKNTPRSTSEPAIRKESHLKEN